MTKINNQRKNCTRCNQSFHKSAIQKHLRTQLDCAVKLLEHNRLHCLKCSKSFDTLYVRRRHEKGSCQVDSTCNSSVISDDVRAPQVVPHQPLALSYAEIVKVGTTNVIAEISPGNSPLRVALIGVHGVVSSPNTVAGPVPQAIPQEKEFDKFEPHTKSTANFDDFVQTKSVSDSVEPKKRRNDNEELIQLSSKKLKADSVTTAKFMHCPANDFCKVQLSLPLSEELETLLKTFSDASKKNKKKPNKQNRINLGEARTNFCIYHDVEIAIKSGVEKGFPEEIVFNEIPSRLGQFAGRLWKVLHNLEQSSFWNDYLKDYMSASKLKRNGNN